jgi:hypothetical protein
MKASAKVGLLLLIVTWLVTKNLKKTAIIVVSHWFAHEYLFAIKKPVSDE